MNLIEKINPEFIEFEGMYYLEYQGGFFKGCKRCGGEGHYQHNGEHSRCYECDNTSAKLGEYIGDDRKVAEKWCHVRALAKANRERKAEEKRMVEVRKMEAKQEALKVADAEVYEFLMSLVIDGWEEGEKDSFLRAMGENLRFVTQANKPFTEKMTAAVRKSMERRQEKLVEAASHPAPSGRVVVTGEIVSAKVQESDFGSTYKILVRDDAGFKVWCSIPKAQSEEAYDAWIAEIEGNDHSIFEYGSAVWFLKTEVGNGVIGRRITFTANLQPSNDDVAFAFGSRPTKGSWLAAE